MLYHDVKVSVFSFRDLFVSGLSFFLHSAKQMQKVPFWEKELSGKKTLNLCSEHLVL